MRVSRHFKDKEFFVNLDDFYQRIKSNNAMPHWYISTLLIEGLTELREKIKAPIIITSGIRTPERNAFIQGSMFSQHLYGRAADITCEVELSVLHDCVKSVEKFKGIGVNKNKDFIHVDVRNSDNVIEWRY